MDYLIDLLKEIGPAAIPFIIVAIVGLMSEKKKKENSGKAISREPETEQFYRYEEPARQEREPTRKKEQHPASEFAEGEKAILVQQEANPQTEEPVEVPEFDLRNAVISCAILERKY